MARFADASFSELPRTYPLQGHYLIFQPTSSV